MIGLMLGMAICPSAFATDEPAPQQAALTPLPAQDCGGLVGERMDRWRSGRLPWMIQADDQYLLSGFESRPGIHPWQGEHMGKWLHAATLAYEQTRDEALLTSMRTAVDRLLKTQEPDGYLGTYAPSTRFTNMPENVRLEDLADDLTPARLTPGQRPAAGWDTWTFRYNLYGLLTYERFHPDDRVVEACRGMADLLIEVYGPGKADLTKYGTRFGVSATTLLESIVMLYERTEDRNYLDFAEHIVEMSEKNPKLRLMGNMLEGESLVHSGEGKAYQLMANLLGYLRLYKHTGDERYLKTGLNGWQDIVANHLDVAGGPWSRRMPYNAINECFAFPRDFDPAVVDIETCSTTTWIQMNLLLLELAGEARFAEQAEHAMLNALLAAQHPNGMDWCYYTRTVQPHRPYESTITCCASSGPRALEMFGRLQAWQTEDGVTLTSLMPGTVALPGSLGSGKIQVLGNYPIEPRAMIRFEDINPADFAIGFRAPVNSKLLKVHLNGLAIEATRNDRGFYQLDRQWKSGDELTIAFEYQLKEHLVEIDGQPVWVAFKYGPFALAETIDDTTGAATSFAGKPNDQKSYLDQLKPLPEGKSGLPAFKIGDTDKVLMPYFAAGSKSTGPRAYFRLETEVKR